MAEKSTTPVAPKKLGHQPSVASGSTEIPQTIANTTLIPAEQHLMKGTDTTEKFVPDIPLTSLKQETITCEMPNVRSLAKALVGVLPMRLPDPTGKPLLRFSHGDASTVRRSWMRPENRMTRGLSLPNIQEQPIFKNEDAPEDARSKRTERASSSSGPNQEMDTENAENYSTYLPKSKTSMSIHDKSTQTETYSQDYTTSMGESGDMCQLTLSRRSKKSLPKPKIVGEILKANMDPMQLAAELDAINTESDSSTKSLKMTKHTLISHPSKAEWELMPELPKPTTVKYGSYTMRRSRTSKNVPARKTGSLPRIKHDQSLEYLPDNSPFLVTRKAAEMHRSRRNALIAESPYNPVPQTSTSTGAIPKIRYLKEKKKRNLYGKKNLKITVHFADNADLTSTQKTKTPFPRRRTLTTASIPGIEQLHKIIDDIQEKTRNMSLQESSEEEQFGIIKEENREKYTKIPELPCPLAIDKPQIRTRAVLGLQFPPPPLEAPPDKVEYENWELYGNASSSFVPELPSRPEILNQMQSSYHDDKPSRRTKEDFNFLMNKWFQGAKPEELAESVECVDTTSRDSGGEPFFQSLKKRFWRKRHGYKVGGSRSQRCWHFKKRSNHDDILYY